eukprot:m.51922 g.51922  ORF g.51922 m.51922 type:complete len:399 (-) comp13465_c0_seq3:71-1267(-)
MLFTVLLALLIPGCLAFNPTHAPSWGTIESVGFSAYTTDNCQNKPSTTATITPSPCTYANNNNYASLSSTASHFTISDYTYSSCTSPYLSSSATFQYNATNTTCVRSSRYSIGINAVNTALVPTGSSICQLEDLYFEQEATPFAPRVYRSTVEASVGGSSSFKYTANTTYYSSRQGNVCTPQPNRSNVFLDLALEGTANVDQSIPHKGMSATLVLAKTTVTVRGNGYYGREAQALVDLLNQECPCRKLNSSAQWRLGETRVIQDADCNSPFPDTYWLCWAMSQGPLRIAFNSTQYAYNHSRFNDTVVNLYSKDMVSFQTNYLGAYGNTNEADCEYPLWSECGGTISQIADACDSATGWELQACVLQVLPDPTHCCPCMVRFANQYSAPWLSQVCFNPS